MKKQLKLKSPNGISFQMLGVTSVILITLFSFVYLMPENGSASETIQTSAAPAATTVVSVSLTTTSPAQTTTVKTVTSSETTSTATTTTTTTLTSTSTATTTATTETLTTTTSSTETTETTTTTAATAVSTAATTPQTTAAPELVTTIAEKHEIIEEDLNTSYEISISQDSNESCENSEYEYDNENENENENEIEIVPEGRYLGNFKITHYCPCAQCCGEYTGLTASGTTATAGRTIGASSNFEFGTQLIIDGHVYVVEDRGGFSENTIDIFCDTHEEALEKGSYYADVYIIED